MRIIPLHSCLIATALLVTTALLPAAATAQTNWNKDGNSFTPIEDNSIVEITLPAMSKTTLVSADQLAPLHLPQNGNRGAAGGRRGFGGGAFQYQLSDDKQKVLI